MINPEQPVKPIDEPLTKAELEHLMECLTNSREISSPVHMLACRLVYEVEALKRFKAYVHRRLDEAGVPVDPPSAHKASGCRIGGRLDVALAQYHKPLD